MDVRRRRAGGADRAGHGPGTVDRGLLRRPGPRPGQTWSPQVCEFPFLNPQTGPFYVEGAEPGDTLAVHFVSIEPARDWAASTTVPLFGALTSTHLTATLQEPLPELVWIWELDRDARQLCRFTRAGQRVHRGAADEPDARHCRRGPGQPGGPLGAGARRLRRQHGHPGDAGRRHLLPRRERGRRAAVGRRRPRPPGRGRDLRGGGGVRNEHGPGRGPAQGRGHALAAAGVGHPHHVRRLGPAAGGRVPDRAADLVQLGGPGLRACR